MELNHFDAQGNAVMVDVTQKPETDREAVAVGTIQVNEEIYRRITEGTVKKGDVLGVARVAGIMGAKRTSELIPLCHILLLTHCSIDFELPDAGNIPDATMATVAPDRKSMPDTDTAPDGRYPIRAVCTVRTVGQTGVEMEALTGVSTALLTIYDMCKAIDKSMQITDIHLLHKTGGKSGAYEYGENS